MAKKREKITSKQTKHEDILGSRLLLLLTISVVYIFMLMFIYNAITGVSHILAGFTAIKVIFFVSIGLLAASIIFFAIRKAKKVNEEIKIITGANTLATGIVFFLASALIFKLDVAAIKFMFVAVPVWFIIYMVFKLYMREFFTVTLTCAIGAGLSFFMYHLSLASAGVSGSTTSMLKPAQWVFFAVIVILSVLVCVFAVKSKGFHGKIAKSDKALRIASANPQWQPLLIAPIILVISLIISIFYPMMLFYAMFILAAFWVVMFVYYTYSMIKK